MNAHQLDANGVILNTIVVDSLDAFPHLLDAALGGAIGDTWNGAHFIKPAPPAPEVPEQVTMRQARLALLAAGRLAAVNTAVAGMAGAQGDAARIEWEFSSTVERHRTLVAALGVILGLTGAQLDDLFIAAAGL